MADSYVVVAKPREEHKCFSMTAAELKACKLPNWTIVACKECDKEYYWMGHEARRRKYFYEIGWWNQWLVDRHHR